MVDFGEDDEVGSHETMRAIIIWYEGSGFWIAFFTPCLTYLYAHIYTYTLYMYGTYMLKVGISLSNRPMFIKLQLKLSQYFVV